MRAFWVIVGNGMLDRFGARVDELESVVREIAIDVTTGTFVERLSPEEVWEKTGGQINLVSELIKELREYLYILKPEKVPTIQRRVAGIYESLDVYRETLAAGKDTPRDSSQLSVDELRKALVEVSDFVSLCRAIKAEPSEVIGAVLSLREEKQDTSPIATAKVVALGELVKEAEASYKEMAELSSKMESNLSAIRSEYEDLLVSLRKKEEE